MTWHLYKCVKHSCAFHTSWTPLRHHMRLAVCRMTSCDHAKMMWTRWTSVIYYSQDAPTWWEHFVNVNQPDQLCSVGILCKVFSELWPAEWPRGWENISSSTIRLKNHSWNSKLFRVLRFPAMDIPNSKRMLKWWGNEEHVAIIDVDRGGDDGRGQLDPPLPLHGDLLEPQLQLQHQSLTFPGLQRREPLPASERGGQASYHWRLGAVISGFKLHYHGK